VTDASSRIDLGRLDHDTWRRIDDILEQVLDLPPEEQPAAVDRLCAGDLALREQIASILATDRAVEGYLSETSRQALIDAAAAPEFTETPLDGRVLGAWRLLHEIGRGGMGAVYLGERADGAFEQRVAIKILGRGLGDPVQVARFRQERQILARLEHPNIARLVDGGVSEDGLWWFAMEYVAGSPITAWSRDRRLETRAALELFQQACRAVQYAHRNLVIHRDLKPSNILVSERGEVKLLDFGIAKILEQEEEGAAGGDGTFATFAAMTPRYAAPEQVRGEAPTTATDVYALGVVLYELLTGAHPYRGRTGTREEIRRAVLEEEPESPSARVKRLGAAGGAPGPEGAGRKLHARPIPRDLDNIVLTAIRKEPSRRYSSVEVLSDDLQRHLDGRAVRASGRTFGYLASKFVRRNRVAVAGAAIVFLTLVGGLYMTARERDRARHEATKAGEMKEFALDLFRVSAPEVGHGADVTARELLDRGAQRVERELKGHPAVQAEMWDLLGSVYRSLDLFPQAIAMYRKSVAARRGLGGAGADTLLGNSLRELGSALYENGDYPEGQKTLEEALAMQRRRARGPDYRVAMVLGEQAVLNQRLGRIAKSESLYKEVLRIDSLTVGMNHRGTATDLANLGMLYMYDSRYDEGLVHVSRALAIRERLLGRDHLEVADGMDQVAMCLAATGELDSAITLGQEALAIRRRWLAPDHPDIAHSLLNIGPALGQAGRLEEAEQYDREGLAIRERHLDPADPLLARGHNELAVTFYRQGKLDSAGVHFDRALQVWAKTLPETHPDVLTCRNNLGVVYRETGRFRESERLLRTVLAERMRTLKSDHLDLAATQYHLGRMLVMAGRHGEGVPLLRQAVESRRAALEEDDPRVAEVRLALGNGLVAMGLAAEGRALIRSSLETAMKRLGPKDRMVVLAKSRT
jgi:serine/threonine protein kinase